MFFVSSFLSGISPRLFSNTNFSPFFTVTRLNSTLLKVQLPKIQIWINFVLCKSFVTRGLGLGFYCSTHSTPNVECDMLCFCQNAYHNKQLLLLLLQNRVLQAAGLCFLRTGCSLETILIWTRWPHLQFHYFPSNLFFLRWFSLLNGVHWNEPQNRLALQMGTYLLLELKDELKGFNNDMTLLLRTWINLLPL